MSINKRQIKFVQEVLLGKTPAEAASSAGYSKNFVSRAEEFINMDWFSEITQLISLGQKATKDEDVDFEVEEFLKKIMRGDSKDFEEEVTLKERMRAAELLAKKYGVFEKTDIPDKVIIVDDIKEVYPDG